MIRNYCNLYVTISGLTVTEPVVFLHYQTTNIKRCVAQFTCSIRSGKQSRHYQLKGSHAA